MGIIGNMIDSVKNLVGVGSAATAPDDLRDMLNRNVDMILEAGTAHLRRWNPYYRDGHNYMWNNQLEDHMRLKGWDRIQENQIFPAAQQSLSLLSLQRPKFLAHPREMTDVDGAAIWEQVLQWQFEEGLNVPQLRLDAKLDGQTHGHYCVYLYWDDKAEWDENTQAWKGKLKKRLLNPAMFICDPDAEGNDPIEDAEYAYYFCNMSVMQLKQDYPDFAEEIDREAGGDPSALPIVQEAMQLANLPEAMQAVTLDGAAVKGENARVPGSELEGRLAGLLGHSRNLEEKLDYVEEDGRVRKTHIPVLLMFLRDRTISKTQEPYDIPMEELEGSGQAALMPDATGAEMWHDTMTGMPYGEGNSRPQGTRTIERPLYPNGRMILRVGAKTVLEDIAWDKKRWPFALGRNIQLPHTWHGLNMAEMAHGMQDFKNIIWANLANYAKAFGQPVTIVEEGAVSGSPNNEGLGIALESRAGAIWKAKAGRINGIQRVPPPPMGDSIFRILERNEQSLKDTLGMQDITLGRKQPGEQTATEALELQTNSKVRTALENLNMDMFTLDLMKLVHMFLRAHYQPGDVVRIIGEGQTVKIDPMMLDAEFDLKMEVGTVLPFDEERERLKADKILGVIGPSYIPEWLKAYDVKRPEDMAAAGMQYQSEIAAAAQKNGKNGPGGEPQPFSGQSGPMAAPAVSESPIAQPS